MPVDPAPLAPVAGTILHYRKLAFLGGAIATGLALYVLSSLLGF